MIDVTKSDQALWETGDGPTRAYLIYLHQAEVRNRPCIPHGTAGSYFTSWTDMAHYRWYFRGGRTPPAAGVPRISSAGPGAGCLPNWSRS